MLAHLQYALNQEQVDYLLYLEMCVTSMFVTTKVICCIMGKPKIKKSVKRSLHYANRVINRLSQEVETMLWKYILATPFSTRKRRRRRSSRYPDSQQKHSTKRRRFKLPKFWQGQRKVLLKRYGTRSHFLHKLKRMKPPKARNRKYRERPITMSSLTSQDDQAKIVTWDSDSFVIGIDQHTSSPISNDKRHFVQLENTTAKVVGADGVPRGIAAGKGTLQWLVEDDEGVVHRWKIPNAYYIPDCPKCLLPPQFFAKYGNTNREKSQCLQLWDRTVLKWGPNGEFTKTIWLSHDRAVPDMTSAASTKTYSAYSTMLDVKTQVESFEVSIPHLIEDYESDQDTTNETSNKDIDEDTIVPINPQLRGEGSVDNEKTHDKNLTDLVDMSTFTNPSTPHVI